MLDIFYVSRGCGGENFPEPVGILLFNELAVVGMDHGHGCSGFLGGGIDRAVGFVVAGNKGLSKGVGWPCPYIPSSYGAGILQAAGVFIEVPEVGDFPPAFCQRAEPFQGVGRDGDMAGVSFPFRILGGDLHGGILPINLFPIEAEHLPVADTTKGHQNECWEGFGGACHKQLGNLLGGEDHGLLAAGLGVGSCGHGVGRDHASTDCVSEQIAQHAAEVHLGLWGER